MLVIVLLLLGVHFACAGTHSLQYFYTATSGLPDIPQFVSLGIVDGQTVTYYDSNIRRMLPRQDWMAKSVKEEYWETETRISVGTEQNFMKNIDVARDRFNHTGGVHTFQQMYGCEWDDETGATDAFRQDAYDGEDFLSLDFKEFRWRSPVQQGLITVQKWNNDSAYFEYEKNYFSNECIEWLKKYLQDGKSSLQRNVSPQVSLLQKSSSSPVACHATGFYPRGVTISWMKNRQEHLEDVDLGELLPNENGTFQKTSTIRVSPEEWKNNEYSCVVEHQGETIEILLTKDNIRTNEDSLPIMPIVGVLFAVGLLIIIGVIGFVVYKKKQGFKPVSGSDDGSSNSSATPNA